jgi:molecular chaperone DnaK
VHSVGKSLKEYGDKVPSDEKAKIEAALKDAEQALKSDDKAEIEAKTQALAQAAHKLAEQMYKEQQPQAQPGAEAKEGGPGKKEKEDESNVVDAEYEEVKDKKG